MPTLVIVDLPITSPSILALMEQEIAPLVGRAPFLLDGGSGLPEEALIEVENITTPPSEAFVMEIIMPIDSASFDVTEVANLSKGMIDTLWIYTLKVI